MKTKRLLLILIIAMLFSVVWFSQNSNYIGNSSFQNILYMNNSAFGYNSIMAYTLFYIVPFLILLTNFFLTDHPYSIVRAVKRKSYYMKTFYKIFLVSIIFSLTHGLINILYTYIFFDSNLLNEVNFLSISVLNVICLVLFYTSIGILFRAIYDSSNALGVSLFLVYIIVGGSFFVVKLFFPHSLWVPYNDLMIYTNLLEKNWSSFDLIVVYLRQAIVIFILYLIGSSVFLKRDYV